MTFFKDIKDWFAQRAGNPLVVMFMLSWIGHHYQLVFAMFFDEERFIDGVTVTRSSFVRQYFESDTSAFLSHVVNPLCAAFLVFLGILFLKYLADKIGTRVDEIIATNKTRAGNRIKQVEKYGETLLGFMEGSHQDLINIRQSIENGYMQIEPSLEKIETQPWKENYKSGVDNVASAKKQIDKFIDKYNKFITSHYN